MTGERANVQTPRDLNWYSDIGMPLRRRPLRTVGFVVFAWTVLFLMSILLYDHYYPTGSHIRIYSNSVHGLAAFEN